MIKSDISNAARERGSEDLWLNAAYRVLVDSGVDAIKVMPLAKSLNLSRTSFYWHFDSRQALLDALVGKWKQCNTGNLIRQTEAYAETITEAVLNLFDCWIDSKLFDARMDFAMRHWAQNSSRLKATLENTDQQRVTAISKMFTRFGFNKAQSGVRAHTVYYTQVGYISMMVEESIADRLKRMPDYVEIFTGSPPHEGEIARFMARHRDLAAV
ncbi:MAG: TetR/AcrR family transcriptional regulator [Gammaproteobacteria bacterium]|nr:TetR/AcrR family transcriptional regulator [Gammaproteobacteria bacterium]